MTNNVGKVAPQRIAPQQAALVQPIAQKLPEPTKAQADLSALHAKRIG